MDRHGVRRPAERIFPTGSKPVYRLTTTSGFQVRLTGDHRVFTVNRGDVPAFELTKDDRIALNPVGFGSDELDVEIAEVRHPDSASNDGVSPGAVDPKAAERLWILSEELTGMKF